MQDLPPGYCVPMQDSKIVLFKTVSDPKVHNKLSPARG